MCQSTALQPVDPGVADGGARLLLPELLQVLVELPAGVEVISRSEVGKIEPGFSKGWSDTWPGMALTWACGMLHVAVSGVGDTYASGLFSTQFGLEQQCTLARVCSCKLQTRAVLVGTPPRGCIAEEEALRRGLPALRYAEPEGLKTVLRGIRVRVAWREDQVHNDGRQVRNLTSRYAARCSLVSNLHRQHTITMLPHDVIGCMWMCMCGPSEAACK